MIVYGDRERRVTGRVAHEALQQALDAVRALDGLARHARITELLIDVGSLTQGLVDREFEQLQVDELTSLRSACEAACFEAARALYSATPIAWQALQKALDALARWVDDTVLTLRDPEGYAFYALYPELYAEAARKAKGEGAWEVIGIRSIGCSLAPVVAAALESERAPVTVRPVGHPFSRSVRIGPQLEARLREGSGERRYAIVDEGPGMSGSSFAAVADYLQSLGVERSRISLFASHEGEPGAAANDSTRQLFRTVHRPHCDFETYFDDASPIRSLAQWFVHDVGHVRAQPLDLSAGHWRSLRFAAHDMPPSFVRDERRKYLLRTESGEWLIKYTGLGGRAPQLAERARVLSDAGFTPTRLAVHHGFSISRFERDVAAFETCPRAIRLERLGAYLAFVVKSFPAAHEDGATSHDLAKMIQHNAGELSVQAGRVEVNFDDARPVWTDSKLEPWEWLATRDGRLLKCDAEDHAAGHDCIGAQDPAWDLAGASIEWQLTPAELEQLCAVLWDHARYRASAAKLHFFRLAYAAFRAGRAHYGAEAVRGFAPEEAQRIDAEKARYVEALRAEFSLRA